MKKIIIMMVASTLIASADAKEEIRQGFGAVILGTLAFPGIIVAEVYALGLQNKGKCDEKHNVVVYLPINKDGERFSFKYTCEEWVN